MTRSAVALHTVRRAVAAAAIVVAAACSDSTSPNAGPSGTYTLRTMNGSTLPFVIASDATGTYSVTSGTIAFNSSSSYTLTINIKQTTSTGSNEAPQICNGTYTRNGTTISFTEENTPDCGGSYTGTTNGSNSLTITFGSSLSGEFTH